MYGFAGSALVIAAVACTLPAADAADPIVVGVGIVPQREIVARVAGSGVRVEVLVQPGHSPASFEPTPHQLAMLADADLYVRAGVPFEGRLLQTIGDLIPELEVVGGRPSVAASGSSSDPHFWLDPVLVKDHAAVVSDALCRLSPPTCEEFSRNLDSYSAELDAVDARIARTLEGFAGRAIYVYHPAYGHFTRRYGLRQVAVEDDGKEPTPRRLAQLIDDARSAGVRTVFVQSQFAGHSARALADAVGAELIELDPLAPDLIANLERMAERIAASFAE